MPDAMEIIFQKALSIGKSGAVSRNFSVVVNFSLNFIISSIEET